METKKVFGKIMTVGLGGLMVAGTIAGAMAADLSDYPSMFIKDGSFDGALVVGSGAKAEDVIGITNIATSLQSISITETTTVLSTDLSVSEGYELCNGNLYVDTSVSDCEPNVDESDLDLLADGVYHDSEGENDNDEKYTQTLKFEDDSTGQFIFTQDEELASEADTYLFLDNGQKYFYQYALEFDSGVTVNDDSDTETGDDLEGTTLTIQGKTYVITDAKLSGGEIGQIEMQSSDGSVWVSEGESVTKIVDGVEHVVELMDVSADATDDDGACGFQIDGTEVWVDVKDAETVNGVTIGVIDAKRVNLEAQNQDVCEFTVGATEITLNDGDEIEFNNEKIDGTMVEITQRTSGSDLEWTGFTVDFAPDTGEVYLRQEDEYIDPIFGEFKIVFSGVETGGTETISFEAKSSSAEITFRNEDGTLVEIPLSASAEATSGEASDESIFWGEEAPVSSAPNVDEQIYLEGETCAGVTSVTDCQGAMFLVIESTKDEAHLLQITSIDTNDNEMNFDDLTYGTTDDDVSYTDGTDTDMDLKSVGEITLNIDEADTEIRFTATGSSDGAEIKTENRGKLTIVNTDVSNTEFEGLLFSEYENGGIASYVTDMEIDMVYDDLLDNHIEMASSSVDDLDSSVGLGWFDASEDNDEEEKFMSFKGTLFSYDRDDSQYLVIEHPYDAVYAKIYIAPTEASASENVAVDVTVNQIAVSAVKLDTEIENLDDQNMILVGGSCANSVVAELFGNPKSCETSLGVESGQALIKLFENGDKVALVIAGQDASDTRLVSEILANWEDYDLSGTEMIATTISESSLSVEGVE